jgi:hypothetical protein
MAGDSNQSRIVVLWLYCDAIANASIQRDSHCGAHADQRYLREVSSPSLPMGDIEAVLTSV